MNGKVLIRATFLAAAAATTLLTMSACSDSSGGNAIPTAATQAPTSSAPGKTSDVTISNSLDTTAFTGNACATLTTDQTTELTISPQGKPADGNGCTWKFGPNLEWSLQIFYVVPDAKNGLQNLYDQKAAGWFDHGYFEPTSVEGYPAAFNNSTDFRPQGTCDLSVGVNEQTIMAVSVHGKAGQNNCDAAGRVASAAVRTIKAGGQ